MEVESTTRNLPDKPNLVPAREEDVDLVMGILNEAAEWLESKGYHTRWRLADLSRDRFLSQIRNGEVFLAKVGTETVGTITLQWTDPVFWNEAPTDAGYVHKFAVRRKYSGRKLGEKMLQWAAVQAYLAGKKYLRLDCLADNKTIRQYYQKAGFIHKGDVQPLGWRASLYEKPI